MMMNPTPSQTSEERNPNLKLCKACGKQMAKGARTCPHCGKTYTTAGGVLIAIVIGLLLAGGALVFRR